MFVGVEFGFFFLLDYFFFNGSSASRKWLGHFVLEIGNDHVLRRFLVISYDGLAEYSCDVHFMQTLLFAVPLRGPNFSVGCGAFGFITRLIVS